MCEECVCVVVYIVKGLSCAIFSDVDDRLKPKMYLYVEFYEYVEVYDGT